VATARQRAADLRYATIARRHGMQNSLRALWEAREIGIEPSLALALSEQESWGRNVFGHDDSIFRGAGNVTKEKYRLYKKARLLSGNRKMQGVGPLQLTWWEYQDEADRLGGCYRPKYNFQVGYRLLAKLIKQHGLSKALAVYNGGLTNPNWTYASQVLAKEAAWHRRLT
jgi:hypothetical protein